MAFKVLKASGLTLILAVCVSLLMVSCTEESTGWLPPPYPSLANCNMDIDSIINMQYMEQLVATGIPIYKGVTPPDITGSYYWSSEVLIASNLSYDSIGRGYVGGMDKYSDYYPACRLLSYENKVKTSLGESHSTAEVSISGTGSNFTVYYVDDQISIYQDDTVTSRQANIVSGTLTSSGIKNCYAAFIMLEKHDVNNHLVPVGAIRVFKEKDGLVEKSDWNSYKIVTSESIMSMDDKNTQTIQNHIKLINGGKSE